MDKKQHWENVFTAKDLDKVSWKQSGNTMSFQLVQKYAEFNDNIIDVGCGTSSLIDNLLNIGYQNITILDISKTALDIVKQRLKDNITYICSDITDFNSEDKFHLWHDRAVLHFLTQDGEIRQYFKTLSNSLHINGVAIISTFANDKIRKCSNLETKAYDKEVTLRYCKDFKLINYFSEEHQTPSGDNQLFNYFILKNKKK